MLVMKTGSPPPRGDRLDGIVLTGGLDMDPRRNGQSMSNSIQLMAERRDLSDRILVRRVVERDIESARDRARQLAESLTEREVEVLACLGEGLSNAQIGARLFLSEATIKGYVSRMLDKLGCANRTQAGLIAHHAGLVQP